MDSGKGRGRKRGAAAPGATDHDAHRAVPYTHPTTSDGYSGDAYGYGNGGYGGGPSAYPNAYYASGHSGYGQAPNYSGQYFQGYPSQHPPHSSDRYGGGPPTSSFHPPMAADWSYSNTGAFLVNKA